MCKKLLTKLNTYYLLKLNLDRRPMQTLLNRLYNFGRSLVETLWFFSQMRNGNEKLTSIVYGVFLFPHFLWQKWWLDKICEGSILLNINCDDWNPAWAFCFSSNCKFPHWSIQLSKITVLTTVYYHISYKFHILVTGATRVLITNKFLHWLYIFWPLHHS